MYSIYFSSPVSTRSFATMNMDCCHCLFCALGEEREKQVQFAAEKMYEGAHWTPRKKNSVTMHIVAPIAGRKVKSV